MANIKIMAESPIMAAELKRAGKMDTLVSYLNLDTNTPGLVRIALDLPDEAAVLAAIKADLAKPKPRVGKTYQV